MQSYNTWLSTVRCPDTENSSPRRGKHHYACIIPGVERSDSWGNTNRWGKKKMQVANSKVTISSQILLVGFLKALLQLMTTNLNSKITWHYFHNFSKIMKFTYMNSRHVTGCTRYTGSLIILSHLFGCCRWDTSPRWCGTRPTRWAVASTGTHTTQPSTRKDDIFSYLSEKFVFISSLN